MQYGIHEIEVTQPFRPLALRQDDDGAAVLLHRKGRPVAFWLASRGEGAEHWTTVEGLSIEISRRAGEKLLSEQVRDELSALHHENMSRGNNSDPPPHRRSLTIAICTHARTEKLARLLESLRSLKGTWLPNQLEIVVVDNAPPDSRTRDHVHRILAENKPPVGASLRYICEPRIGLDFARNRALCEARGEWIAFLDDDVVVEPHWITGLDEAWLENPDAVAVTGLVLPLVLETESQILFERYGGFRRGCDKIRFHGPTRPGNPLYPCGAGIFGAGANMAFEVDTLRSLGGFDNALDTGATLPGGGDLDIFYRVIRAGYPLVYEPSMTVRHEHRRDLSGLTAQYESWGKGFMAFIGKSGKTDRALSRRLSRTRIWWWLDTSKQAVLALLGQHPLPLRMVLAAARGGLIGSCGEFGRSQRRVKAIRQSVEADITSDDGDLQRPAEEPARAQPAIRPGGVPTSTKGSEFRPWRIANLQLLAPLPSLAAEANGSGLFLVLWCGDVPLGHLWIAARSLPIPPRRLIAGIAEVIAPALGDHLLSGFREPLPMPPLTRHRKLETPILHELLSLKEPLQLLSRSREAAMEQPPGDRCSVSVVVCTRDRPDDLAQCLASVDRLDPKPDEVLVVDNAPERPSTREVVGRHAGRDIQRIQVSLTVKTISVIADSGRES